MNSVTYEMAKGVLVFFFFLRGQNATPIWKANELPWASQATSSHAGIKRRAGSL